VGSITWTVSPVGAVLESGVVPWGESRSSWVLDNLTSHVRGKRGVNPAKTRPGNNIRNRNNDYDRNTNNTRIKSNNRFPLLCNNNPWSCRLTTSYKKRNIKRKTWTGPHARARRTPASSVIRGCSSRARAVQSQYNRNSDVASFCRTLAGKHWPACKRLSKS
jgi:hypothetical protein